MRYLLLVHKREEQPWEWWRPMALPSPPGMLREVGTLCPASSATTLKLGKGSRQVIDGPFFDGSEQPAGFYLLDCADLDQALAWAGRLTPAAGAELWVEVRPLEAPPP